MADNGSCWYCGGKLCWRSDFSYDEVNCKCDECTKDSCEGIVTFLVCQKCGAEIEYSQRCDRGEDTLCQTDMMSGSM